MSKATLVVAVVLLAVLAGAAEAVPSAAAGATRNPFESQAEPTPKGQIDELVFGRLKRLGIQPANLCSDAVFVRRACLDVIGTLPTAKEARDFLLERSPNKRQALIERLLERDEFADYWAMKWSDLLRIKAEFPINLWPNAAQAYHHWVRTCLRENLPYDRFVREMLTASGSNFRVPQVNFYRAMQSKEPQAIAQAVALTFMGTRAENWPKDRLSGLGAFFSQVGYKQTAEWKEEIVFFDPARTNTPAAAVFPDGTPARLSLDRDPREVFADWLLAPNNPWFARNIANRVWSWLLGRGIIQEPDDIRPDNPPSNPELLAYLEQELVASHYDLKHLYRLVLNSKTYQLASLAKDAQPEGEANFSRYPLRRLEAEVLIDALNQITGTTEKYSSAIPEPFTYVPEEQRSIALPDGSITSSFLELFGRPSRDTGLEAERNNRPTAAQQLHLLNSSHIQSKLEQSRKLQNLLQSKGSPREIVNGLYLMILSRFPTEEELKVVAGYSQGGSAKGREALVDVAWALVNSAEFFCTAIKGICEIMNTEHGSNRRMFSPDSISRAPENGSLPVSRREALRRGLLSAAGLMLANGLALPARAATPSATPKTNGKARSVIQIWMWGGPSHLDTFDPKPEAGNDYCGPLDKPIATTVDGIRICELLPLLGKQADKYSIIRSMTHGVNGHETASYTVQTGRLSGGRDVYPSVGAVVSLFKGYDGGYRGLIPPYIVLTELQGRFSEAGFLGARYKPFATGGDPGQSRFVVEGVVAPGISDQRQRDRRELLHNLNTLEHAMKGEPRLAALAQCEQEAYDLILGDAGKVFDLSQEKDELRERYGKNTFGQSCLMARRLVERGVPYVTINYKGWDTHKQNFQTMRRKLPEMDKGMATLLQDLSERGLLDSTIVWWGGEFGRTPKVLWEPPWSGGRNHYGAVFSAVVAGGGFKGGHLVGASDRRGEEVKERPVYPCDLIGSIYDLLGIAPDAKLPHPQGLVVRATPSAAEGVSTGRRLTEIM